MKADKHSTDNALPRKFTKPSSISTVLKCVICTEVFVFPLRLFCGHTFCSECINQWTKASKKCPVCRQDIDSENISVDLMAAQIVGDLQVFCPSKDCPWKGQLSLMEMHFNYQCELALADNNSHKKSKQKQGKDLMPMKMFDEDVEQKINENTNKGSLLARVFHKNQDQQQSAVWIEKTRSLMVGQKKISAPAPQQQSHSEAKTRKGKKKNEANKNASESKKEQRKNEDIDFLLELYQ